jgi:hypothetical protein
MAASDQFDRFPDLGVRGDRAVMDPTHAHDLGQPVRISGIRLRP